MWQSETSPNQGIPNQVPRLGLVSLFQIWDFCGYSLNTQKYPKMGIRYFFLCQLGYPVNQLDRDVSSGYRLGPGLPVVKGVYPIMQCGYFYNMAA